MTTHYRLMALAALIAGLVFGSCTTDNATDNGNGDVAEQPSATAFGEDGASYAVFSVSDNKQVRFSRGNLQYKASSGSWRFAEQQYDMIGEGNTHISNTYTGWIDLFGWGTGDAPTRTSTSSSDYPDYHEWGDHPIANGGNRAQAWRSLTVDEWLYLTTNRPNASSKIGLATIGGQYNGLVILPDSWTMPAGMSFAPGNSGFDLNNYTIEDWQLMETAGAVFLPAAGVREGAELWNFNNYGLYWSSSSYNAAHGYDMFFWADAAQWTAYDYRYLGLSVRLVME